jgi:hypothetical protein
VATLQLEGKAVILRFLEVNLSFVYDQDGVFDPEAQTRRELVEPCVRPNKSGQTQRSAPTEKQSCLENKIAVSLKIT